MKKQPSVMAIPATENKADNPYNYILYSHLQKLNVAVKGYSLKALLKPNDCNIVHFHWPENFVSAASTKAACKGFATFYLKMLYLKACGKKIVWTVHNLAPHENRHPRLMKRFYRLLYKNVNGFISLTQAGADEILRQRRIAPKKIAVIPHPHYLRYYADGVAKEEARKKLGIPNGKFVFLFAGQVRAYKNVLGLVKAFKELHSADSVLVIAGKVHADVAAPLEEAIKGQANIKLFPSFIHDDELQVYLNAADLVVTPFNKVLNSGSVFLNLSFAKPTLVPATESLLELQKEVGGEWLQTFSGELTAVHLKKARAQILQSAAAKPDLKNFEPEKIAAQTKAFYQSLLN